MNIQLLERDGRVLITVVADTVDITQIERDAGLIPLQTYIAETRALADKSRRES